MIGRRAFVAALAGIPVGIAAGSVIRWWIGNEPSIRFIGQRNTIISLFDSGSERMLVFLGEPDGSLLEHIPALLTYGQTRIDLVVASHNWLTSDGIRAAIDLDSTPVIALQGDVSLPPISGTVTTVVDSLAVELGGYAEVAFQVGSIVNDDPTDPLFVVDIAFNGVRMLLANQDSALELVDDGAQLLAIPGNASVDDLTPSVFVGTERHAQAGFETLLVYYDEPIELLFNDNQLSVKRR